MNSALCSLFNLTAQLLTIYTIVLFVYAVISWLPDLRGRWTDYLAMAVEPVLAPIRRLIPPVSGIDLAFLALILLLFVLRNLVGQLAANACYF